MIGLPRFPRTTLPASARQHRIGALSTVLWATLAIASTPSFAQTPASDPVIAVVGATEIRQSDLRLAEEDMGKMLAGFDEAGKRRYLTSYLNDLIILSNAARDRGLVNEEDLKKRMNYTRNKALMERLLQVTAEAVTDADVRKFYDELVRTTKPEPELHLRAIIFKFSDPNDKASVDVAETKAKKALERVAKGEAFTAVAHDMTEATDNKMNGGDLGWLVAPQMGKEYADVAFTLGKGAVSKPIKTGFGWHILKVEEERIRKPNEFAAVRDQVEIVVRRKAQTELVDKLRAETPIERRDLAAKPE